MRRCRGDDVNKCQVHYPKATPMHALAARSHIHPQNLIFTFISEKENDSNFYWLFLKVFRLEEFPKGEQVTYNISTA
jgi:hypothetical protein